MQGLDWQSWRMQFVAGLNQKLSDRMLAPPELTIAKDVQFTKTGDIETRYPFLVTETGIQGGGTLADYRRIVANDDELLVFTKDGLYSQSGQTGEWILRGTHLAVKVDEQPVFVTTGEQTQCDRAELDGLVVYAWTDDDKVYAAAKDKYTGAVVVAPVDLAAGGTGVLSRPRLVALDTVILLFTSDATSGSLQVTPIDPADPVGTIAGSSPIGDAAHDEVYDVTRVIGSDLAVLVQRCAGSTYSISTVAPDLVEVPLAKARTCDGPIAVSCSPTGTHAQVIRADGNNIVGDLILLSDLSDVYTAQAVGTTTLGDCYQIAAAHRSVTDSGAYRCYAFWTDGNSSQPGSGSVRSNWVDTGNTLGTEAQFVHAVGVASRAFDRDGRVFVNLVFAGLSDVTTSYNDYQFKKSALQNTYFLYRDDAFLVAKMAMNRAGGLPSTGHLPGVASDPDDSRILRWCGTERRIVPTGNGREYADRGPRDLALAFDSNDARRCVRMGETLYIACGEGLLQYDGLELVEVGFHHAPYSFTLLDSAGGAMADGVYFYEATARSQNAKGDVDRSTTAAAGGIEISGGPDGVQLFNLGQLYVTHKTRPAIEVWRTLMNPAEDVPYYKVTDSDPTNATGDNCYLANDGSGTQVNFVDALEDADVRELEQNAEVGTVLENLPPPPAKFIVASDTRIFLAGVAGDPNRVWYSKQRADGQIASFHDSLVVSVPSSAGAIVGLAYAQETPVVFCEDGIFLLLGDGIDNSSGGQNYVARQVPDSRGAGAINQDAIADTERGMVFKTSKGWYLLSRAWSLEYIGGPVKDYDAEVPLAIDVVKHQVRIVLALYDEFGTYISTEDPADLSVGQTARMLVLDTQGGQWFEWSVTDAIHSCVYGGTHFYLSASGPKNQLVAYQGVTYGIDVETAWIDLGSMQAYGRVRRIEAHGLYLSGHTIRWRLARDHWADGVDTYFDDETWTPSPTTAGGPLECEHGPSIPQVNQIKVRLTVTPTDGGAGCKLSYLDFELGFKRGLYRRLPEAQRQ